MNRIPRRKAVELCVHLCSTSALCAAISGCHESSYFVRTYPAPDAIGVQKSELFKHHEHRISTYYVLIKDKRLRNPICLFIRANGGYSAVEAVCTHKSCRLMPHSQGLSCPCHGSEFDIEGTVLVEPASKPLRRFAVKEDGEFLYVLL